MRSETVLEILADHREELDRYGVTSIALFGSTARDEAGPASDVDILVEFDAPPSFDTYVDVKLYLEDLLGTSVDLVTLRALKPRVRPYVERDAIYVPPHSRW